MSSFELIQVAPEAGDCTAPYEVRLNRDYTVKIFVEDILKDTREWGSIRIRESDKSFFSLPEYEYKYGKLLSRLPNDVLSKRIKSATAHGGWSLMDYLITLED